MAKVTEPVLAVDGLTRSFGGVRAVTDVSLAVADGELRGIIGPNGAGKSTLFRMLAGALHPDSGSIHLRGFDVTGWPAWKVARAGMVRTFQASNPIPTLSVLENVAVGNYTQGSSGLVGALFRTEKARVEEQESLERAYELLTRFHIEHLADVLPTSLTAGQRRQVELARVLIGRPEIMLLDEPAAGLNAAETANLRNTLLELKSEGQTVLLIEHDVELVLAVSDRVTTLVAGEVLAEGLPEDIYNDPAVMAAYLGTHGAKSQ